MPSTLDAGGMSSSNDPKKGGDAGIAYAASRSLAVRLDGLAVDHARAFLAAHAIASQHDAERFGDCRQLLVRDIRIEAVRNREVPDHLGGQQIVGGQRSLDCVEQPLVILVLV